MKTPLTERLCGLCEKPMGSEIGAAHKKCYDLENYLDQNYGCGKIVGSLNDSESPCQPQLRAITHTFG